MNIPNLLYSGKIKEGHVQGIAIDEKRGYVYYSFTTLLLKTDFDGKHIGTVENLIGHLGCITFDPDRNRIYGSLELKHDAIGAGIEARTGKKLADEDCFYLVSFDCDLIDRMNMDAESDGIMKAMYLADVVRDFTGNERDGHPHRYGCSGFDGTAYGPALDGSGDRKITIAYGIYSDTERDDNDHQVLLQYSPDDVEKYGKVLTQAAPHHSGAECEKKYFFRTGNTDWGVQNLEYDPYLNAYLVAVYTGRKSKFKNFPLFFIDASEIPTESELIGRNGEMGLLLSPLKIGEVCEESGAYGSYFPLGSTGMVSLGGGEYLFSEPASPEPKYYCSTVKKYRFNSEKKDLFDEVAQ